MNIGGIVHSKSQGDTKNWIGVAAPNGTCVVSYKEDYGIILNWSGKADPSISKYPFNTNETDFFPLLYKTDFWQDMRNNTNFEFDSRCPDSKYVPSIIAEIKKLDKSGKKSVSFVLNGYLDIEKEIPVIIQTGDKKYYVSETTTGTRNGKEYVTISKSLTTQNQYKEILKNGKKFSTLEEAYDAYLKALGDSKYDSVRQSQS